VGSAGGSAASTCLIPCGAVACACSWTGSHYIPPQNQSAAGKGSPMQNARLYNIIAAFVCALAFTTTVAHAADALPSWNDGKAKQSIVAFVAEVTKQGSPNFVPPAERIATFDNDGTLWVVAGCDMSPIKFTPTIGIVSPWCPTPSYPRSLVSRSQRLSSAWSRGHLDDGRLPRRNQHDRSMGHSSCTRKRDRIPRDRPTLLPPAHTPSQAAFLMHDPLGGDTRTQYSPDVIDSQSPFLVRGGVLFGQALEGVWVDIVETVVL